MKITGKNIKFHLKSLDEARATTTTQIAVGLKEFFVSKDKGVAAREAFTRYEKLEEAISVLQVAQARYNLNVKVVVNGLGEMTIYEAVKRLDGVKRAKELWTAATPNRYGVKTPKKHAAPESIELEYIPRGLSENLEHAIGIGDNQLVEVDIPSWIFLEI